MRILVVQESDWLERNPHQQHHLMERMALRGHEIRVIDYPIDWPNDDDSGLIYHKEIHENVSKIKPGANIDVIRPGFIKIKGLNYATLFFTHKNEIERQTACLKELLQWRECFDILYFTPETAYHPKERSAEREKWMNRLYKEYFARVKDLAPEKRILMSPASRHPAGYEADFLDFWNVMLDGVPLDILCPQDSIGCSGCLLSEQDAMWKLWKEMTSSKGITLWAHMELFERRCFGGPAPFISAPPERVLNQTKNLAPYIEKCICFEYPFFAKGAERADALRTRLFGR